MTQQLGLGGEYDDGVGLLSEWRRVLEAQKQYEQAWRLGERPEVLEYAARFAEVSSEVLIPELERLRGELQAVDNGVRSSATAGRYVDLQLLRAGGMGEVFSALDVECGRRVALKKIRHEYAEDEEVRQRFLLEGELTALLEHPGVIPIYGRGVDSDGRDFYVMRLIAGSGTGTLRQSVREFHEQLSDGDWSVERQARFRGLVQRVLDVAGTAAYAHARGIVHRDLKPANILIGPQGETLIGDWGLARRIDSLQNAPVPASEGGTELPAEGDGPDLVAAGRLSSDSGFDTASESPSNETCAAGFDSSIRPATTGVGTLGFAAPEQLSLQATISDLRLADIYSLGAILICVLTGKSPLNGTQPVPRALHSVIGIPGLLAVAMRALQSDPHQRYASMSELCVDLERWLAGEPVSAYREGFIERLWRWPRRHRLLSSALASGLLISLLGSAIFLVVQSRQKAELQSQSQALGQALKESAVLLEENRRAREVAEGLRVVAEQSRAVAEQARAAEALERQQAQAREQLAFEAVGQFQELIVASPLLRFTTELSPLRDQLMENSRSFLETLFQQLDNQGVLSEESLQRLVRTAEGSSRLENELGHQGEAYRVAERACVLLRKQIVSAQSEQRPTQVQNLYLGELLTLQGSLGMRYGWPDQAGPVLEEAVATLDPLLGETSLTKSQRERLRMVLTKSASSLAVQVLTKGNSERAKLLIRKGLEVAGDSPPQSIDSALLILQCYGNLSLILERNGDFQGAIAELQKAETAWRVAESLVTTNTTLRMQMELRLIRSKLMHNQISLLQQQKGETAEVLRLLRTQLQYETVGLQQFASAHAIQNAYSRTVTKLLEVLLKAGEAVEAQKTVAEWLQRARELQPAGGVTEMALVFLMTAQHSSGHVQDATGNPEQAGIEYRAALETALLAGRSGFRNSSLLLQLIELHGHLAAIGLQRSEMAEVEAQLQAAVAVATELQAIPDDSPGVKAEEASMRKMLQGNLQQLRQAGQVEAADRWEREMRERKLIQ